MAITPKPKRQGVGVDVDALINRGGTASEPPVPTSTAPQTVERPVERPKGKVNFILRCPADVANRIDEAIEARAVRIPRNTWIIEAIVERLSREKAERR